MALHLHSRVIMDIFWIQVKVDLKSQPTVWLLEIGIFILQNAGNVIILFFLTKMIIINITLFENSSEITIS